MSLTIFWFGEMVIECNPAPWQVMNEVALHRGSSPHLNTIDIYVDGQHLTEAVVSKLITTRYPACHLNFRVFAISVGWSNNIHPYGLHGVFSLCGRSHSAPITKRISSHSNMSSESVLSATCIPLIIVHHSPGTSHSNTTFSCPLTSSCRDFDY